MKKTIFALLLVVALVAVLAIPAAAEGEYNPYHCVCGAQQYATKDATTPIATATCLGDCDGKNHEWIPITESVLCNAEGKLLVGAIGNYKITDLKPTNDVTFGEGNEVTVVTQEDLYVYLDKSFTTADMVKGPAPFDALWYTIVVNPQQSFGSGEFKSDATAPFGFHLDLNGNSLTSSNRMFRVDGYTDALVDFSICDTKGGGAVIHTGSDQALRGQNAVANEMNLYNVKLQNTKTANTSSGKVIYLSATNKLNAYNCELVGTGAGDAGNGGIIYSNGGVVKLYDTSLTKGYGVGGGAIWAGGGSVDLYGNTTISDCKTKNGGAGIWINTNTTKITMHDNATITGCTSGNKGAVIIVGGDLIMKDNAKIVNNVGGDSYAGGVHFNDPANSRLTVSGNVKITGNTNAQGAGNVVITKKGATATTWGRIKIDGSLGNNAEIGVSLLNAGTDGWGAGGSGYFAGEFVASNATSKVGFSSDSGNYTVNYANGALSLAEKTNIFLVDGVEKTWAEAQASGKLITLGSDIGEIAVSQNVALDFAGYTVEELKINGNQFVKVADTVTGKVLAKTGAGALVSSNPDKSLTLAQDGSLTFTAAPVFKVGDNAPVVWSEAKTADRVTMVGDLYAHIVVDKENQVIDLAGNNLGAVLTTVGDRETNEGYLKIIDSETNDYDADGNGYGIVFARDGSGMRFYGERVDTWVDTTGYKYIRVYDGAEGQSFHRVYFAVTHSVLQMKDSTVDPYMQYKTNLKCTPKLAALINNDANVKYGFAVTLSGKTAIDYYDTANNPVTGGGVDNVRITAVTFKAEDIEGKEQTYLESDLGAQAVIAINGGDQKSAMKSRSVKAMVQSVMANQWNTWTGEKATANKALMKAFYTKYEDVMSTWDKIDDLKN